MSNSQLKVGLSLPFTEIADLANIDNIPECFELAELSGETVMDINNLPE